MQTSLFVRKSPSYTRLGGLHPCKQPFTFSLPSLLQPIRSYFSLAYCPQPRGKKSQLTFPPARKRSRSLSSSTLIPCLPPHKPITMLASRIQRRAFSVSARNVSIRLLIGSSSKPFLLRSCADVGCLVAVQGRRSRCRRWHRPAPLPASQAQPQGVGSCSVRYPRRARYVLIASQGDTKIWLAKCMRSLFARRRAYRTWRTVRPPLQRLVLIDFAPRQVSRLISLTSTPSPPSRAMRPVPAVSLPASRAPMSCSSPLVSRESPA